MQQLRGRFDIHLSQIQHFRQRGGWVQPWLPFHFYPLWTLSNLLLQWQLTPWARTRALVTASGYSGRGPACTVHLSIHPHRIHCVYRTHASRVLPFLEQCLKYLDSCAGLSEGGLRDPWLGSGRGWACLSSFALTSSLGTTSHFLSCLQRINLMQGQWNHCTKFSPGLPTVLSTVFYCPVPAPAQAG